MPEKPSRTAETSQGDEAYQRLVAQIRSGALKPGDRLTETDIAARLGMSRTPVREAIRQLESDGLVDHQPRAGAHIRQLRFDEVTELYEMRAVLEGAAARFAARAAHDSELEALSALNADLAAPDADEGRLYRLNRQFHDVMLSAGRNRFLIRSTQAVQKTLLILGPSTMRESGRAAEAVAEHAAILDALRARDGAAAEAAMRHHIEAAHRVRLRQMHQDLLTDGD